MRGAVKLPFTRGVPEEPKTPISLKVPASMAEYLRANGITELVIRGVELDRTLGDALKPLDARIDAYAKSKGLSREVAAGAIIAQLVELGLDAYESGSKGKSGK